METYLPEQLYGRGTKSRIRARLRLIMLSKHPCTPPSVVEDRTNILQNDSVSRMSSLHMHKYSVFGDPNPQKDFG